MIPEGTWALTSLNLELVTASWLATLTRGHWEIENRLHHVRCFTRDEDRSRAQVGGLPQNLA